MKLLIKNMVCNRCIRVINDELTQRGFHIKTIQLGEVDLHETLTTKQLSEFERLLRDNGFELIKDKKAEYIELIKKEIIHLIYSKTDWSLIVLSTYLEKKVGKDYNYLSSLFSSVESITIEKYAIVQKIERIKELIIYDDFNLSQIAYELGYSSVQHMSSQFKKVTGMTPSEFKKLGKKNRRSIDLK